MRSSLLLASYFLLVLAGCQKQTTPAMKYGAPLSLHDETRVSQILAEPESYLGKKVLVQGEILEVCAKAGCWMEIAGDLPEQRIKVKVNDGEIIFPMTARGKTGRVEGQIYKIDLSAEQARGYLAHLAEEKGVAFDSSSVSGPITIYQIKGLGTEISD